MEDEVELADVLEDVVKALHEHVDQVQDAQLFFWRVFEFFFCLGL